MPSEDPKNPYKEEIDRIYGELAQARDEPVENPRTYFLQRVQRLLQIANDSAKEMEDWDGYIHCQIPGIGSPISEGKSYDKETSEHIVEILLQLDHALKERIEPNPEEMQRYKQMADEMARRAERRQETATKVVHALLNTGDTRRLKNTPPENCQALLEGIHQACKEIEVMLGLDLPDFSATSVRGSILFLMFVSDELLAQKVINPAQRNQLYQYIDENEQRGWRDLEMT